MLKQVIMIGYSGHSFVAIDILQQTGFEVKEYCDGNCKEFNPFNLKYLGKESDIEVQNKLKQTHYFISIGANTIRRKIYESLFSVCNEPVNAIHPSSIIGANVKLLTGIFIGPGVLINSLSEIGKGVVCNTGAVIEHECKINNFSFISPGAVLCGNVTIGQNSFVGANAVIKQGVVVGNNVTIGAGTVVLENIQDGLTVVGNPQKIIK